jgi:hypothetical protein
MEPRQPAAGGLPGDPADRFCSLKCIAKRLELRAVADFGPGFVPVSAARVAPPSLYTILGYLKMNAKIWGAFAVALVLTACGGKKEEAAPAPEAAAPAAVEEAATDAAAAVEGAATDAAEAVEGAATDAAAAVEGAATEAAEAVEEAAPQP